MEYIPADKVIQSSINKLPEQNKSKGMKFSSEKTVVVKDKKRNKRLWTTTDVAQQQNPRVHYTLGLVINKKLYWKHIGNLKEPNAFQL